MKNYQVLWSDDAEFDLETIITYIMIDSIDTAKKIFYAIKETCQQLHYFPERKRIVPELQQIGMTHYRECIYQRWRVIFKIQEGTVHVLMVIDSSQNIEDILLQRLMLNVGDDLKNV